MNQGICSISGFDSLHVEIIHGLEGDHSRVEGTGDVHFPPPTGHIHFIDRLIGFNHEQPGGAA
jgi:Fic family protein